MKRILCALLIMMFTFNVLIIGYAENDILTTLVVDEQVNAGDVVCVSVDVSDNSNITGCSFNLVYDNSAFTLQSYSAELLKAYNPVVNTGYTDHSIRVSSAGTFPITNGGSLIVFFFTSKTSACGSFDFSVEKMKISTPSFDSRNYYVNKVSINVLPYETPQILINTESNYVVNEERYITIDIEKNNLVCGGVFNLVYDNTVFEIVSVTQGYGFSGATPIINKNYAPGKIRVTWAGTQPMSQSGTLMNVLIKPLKATENTSISIEGLKVSDDNGVYLRINSPAPSTCSVTEKPKIISVTGVSIEQEDVSICVGLSAKITAYVSPIDATNQNIIWSISDDKIADIMQDGTIIAKDVGNALITATTEDGGFTASCTLTVPNCNIGIGDYLLLGQYYGAPVLWRCVDIDENGPLMLSDKVLCFKEYDGAGSNTDASHGRGYFYSKKQGYWRRSTGSNYWGDSNIRCWLNSNASAGNVEWLCGNAPESYNDEAGFLSGFTSDELKLIKEVVQKSILDDFEYSDSNNIPAENAYLTNNSLSNYYDNYSTAFSEELAESIFLLDVKQMRSVYANSDILGEQYYIGEPTEQCVINDKERLKINCDVGKKCDTILRTPKSLELFSSYRPYIYVIQTNGGLNFSNMPCSIGGIRPAFYLNEQYAILKSGNGSAEKPYQITEKRIASVSYEKREDVTDFHISVENLLNDCLIIATYDDKNRLQQNEIIYCNNKTEYCVSFPSVDYIAYAKVFVWNSLEQMTPCCESKTVIIESEGGDGK